MRGWRIRRDAFCRDVCAHCRILDVPQGRYKGPRHANRGVVYPCGPNGRIHADNYRRHVCASRGITADREHAEPLSGDRRSAIIKTALSPLPGLFRRIVPTFSPRLRHGPHYAAPNGAAKRTMRLRKDYEAGSAESPPPRLCGF